MKMRNATKRSFSFVLFLSEMRSWECFDFHEFSCLEISSLFKRSVFEVQKLPDVFHDNLSTFFLSRAASLRDVLSKSETRRFFLEFYLILNYEIDFWKRFFMCRIQTKIYTQKPSKKVPLFRIEKYTFSPFTGKKSSRNYLRSFYRKFRNELDFVQSSFQKGSRL